jgi:predicted aspartyl protease
MSSRSTTLSPKGEMGQVSIRVHVRNFVDFARARAGEIALADVREVDIDDALADTGATHLCLPPALVRQLGLVPFEEVLVATATGMAPARIYGGALVTVDGRTRELSCLELPGGGRPLLGAIPLEELGIELDLAKRSYRLLPDDGPETYLTA